ncbi:unnamed protein product [Chironomus riparius]|uniref:Uncharacterized protein n=1 Tax=Chironomus riparius TaxID=315576 RepID=A0A9N9RTI9_9DIPT|nr:unnamed protein product [Chironomus riparius]
MQNLASKIESRATNTKAKMNNMILSLDETKVRMSNLTRINDIKNTVYCENLITDDHLEPIQEVPKTTVKLSTNIAIQNGLKLMENCFERHRVNLDPSSNRTEISTVYRPIDKFYSPLPYLIGEKNWKEKWHLGLIEEDKYSQTGSTYAESVESNITSNSRVESDNLIASESNLMASQTSLSKSNSSIGDQMIINKQVGLFDEVYTSEQITPTIKQPTTTTTTQSTFFAPQQSERKIVNLFDDEPPELTVESSHNRKPVNLFDDVDSVLSMPLPEPEMIEKPLPPVVDLFNDNEFDNFIQKIEINQQKNQTETPKKDETVKDEKKANMQRDMKNIAAEIKNVHLRKTENVIRAESTVTKTVQAPQADKKVIADNKQEVIKTEVSPEQKAPDTVSKKVDLVIKSTPTVKARQKITNLFDDDDDESEDFFTKIIKQKDSKLSQLKKEEPIMHKSTPEIKKNVNLFDDEDDDDFESIFNKKPSINVSTPKADTIPVNTRKSEESDMQKGYQTHPSMSQNVENTNEKAASNDKPQTIDKIKRHKKLFDDDEDENDNVNNNNSLFKSEELTSSKTGQESEKKIIIVKERESEQAMGGYLSAVKEYIYNQSDEVVESSSSIAHEDLHKNDIVDKIEENLPINENDLFKANKSDAIIANCPDNDNDAVPNIESEPENQNTVVNNQTEKNNINYEARTDVNTSLSKEFNNPVLFLVDEPPDDNDIWDTDDNNFEDPEEREVLNQNTSNYLAFNEIPPDDDYINQPIESLTHIEDDDEDDDDFLSAKSDILSQKTVKKESLADIFSPKSQKKDSGVENVPKSTQLFGNDSGDELLIPKLPKIDDKISSSKLFDFDDESDESQSQTGISKVIESKHNDKLSGHKTIAELLSKINSKPETSTEQTQSDGLIPTTNANQAKIIDNSSINIEQDPTLINKSLSTQKIIKTGPISATKEAQSSAIRQNEQSPIKSNIKSKLDMFTKPQEQSTAQQDSPPKKLPGKLNKTLAINVNALMPGARIPRKAKVQSEDSFDSTPSQEELDSSSSSTDKSLTEKSASVTEKSTSVAEKSSISEKSPNSGLLNNDLTKLRAKIQVKRRPSTRRGRQAIYDQTLNTNIVAESIDNDDEKSHVDNAATEVKQTDIVEPIITQSNSLSGRELVDEIAQAVKVKSNLVESSSRVEKKSEEAKNIQDHKHVNVKSNILDFFDDEPPPFDSYAYVEHDKATKTGVTSKSRVFYDDKDETRKMLEEEKKKSSEKGSSLLFDDNSKNDSKKSADITKKALFDDDSDNDLFPASKIVTEKPKKNEIEKIKEAPKSLFNDDDDDDLFGTVKKKVPEKSTKLFDSENDNKLDGSIIFSKSTSSTKPKKQSIFGDDDYDDDDDLFSSKPKSGSLTSPSVTKPISSSTVASKSTPSAGVKKTASTAVNDPLKDLMGN